MLGFLHKRVLGLSHPGVNALLPFQGTNLWHDKTLESYFETVCAHPRLYQRSLCQYVLIYNRLAQFLVDEPSVRDFQKSRNVVAKCRAHAGERTWRDAYQNCMDVMRTLH